MTETIKKLFRLAAIETSEGPLHILWTLDEDGVWVLPWASLHAGDQRRLGETIARVGSFSNPRMPAEIVELTGAGAEFVELTSEQAALCMVALSRRLDDKAQPGADFRALGLAISRSVGACRNGSSCQRELWRNRPLVRPESGIAGPCRLPLRTQRPCTRNRGLSTAQGSRPSRGPIRGRLRPVLVGVRRSPSGLRALIGADGILSSRSAHGRRPNDSEAPR